MSKKIKIYTDGSSIGNPGPGGYGIVMLSEDGEYKKEFSQGFKKTTNNRMELLAVIVGLENLKLARDEVNEEIATMKDNYNKAIQIGDNVGGGAFAKYLFDREDISYLAGLANQTQETRADEISMLKKNFELLPPEVKAKYEDGEFGDVVKERYDSEVDSLKIKKGLVNTNNMGEATANTLAGKVQTMVDRGFEPRRQAIIDTVSTSKLKESIYWVK